MSTEGIGDGAPGAQRVAVRLTVAALASAVVMLSGLTAPSAAAGPLVTSWTAGVLVQNTTQFPGQPACDTADAINKAAGSTALYATQAGSHPYCAFTAFTLDTSQGNADAVRVDLPPGVAVNPQAIPQCPQSDISSSGVTCPADTQLGTADVTLADDLCASCGALPVYNMAPAQGEPGDFAFDVCVGVGLTCLTQVRTDLIAGIRSAPYSDSSDGYSAAADYGDYFKIAPDDSVALQSTTLDFWGAPEEHNGGGAPDNAFLTNPTACAGPQTTTIDVTTTTTSGKASFTTPVGASGCSSVPFSPSITATPSTTQRDTPDGLSIDVHVPQDENPAHIASANLQDATVTLPPGLTIDPSAADGLQACTDAQFGAGTDNAIACPAASVVGTAEIDTPLLPTPLSGSIYIGQPETGNPYRIFLNVANAASGVDVRLVGTATPDPSTGQLTTTFANNPQVPFTDFKLTFDGGANALLANPIACGPATTTSRLTPYSGNAAATPTSLFTVDNDGSGGACRATLPFAPTVSPTVSSTQAGGYSDLTLKVSRTDADQTLSTVTTQLPPGMLANLNSTTLCGEPAATNGTCAAASEIGTTTVSAGAGPDPLTLPGTVYMTGPYGGAPFGLSIVVPAIAGPYNLGNVVVRAAVTLNTVSGQLTIATDPLPTIVGGIPLRLKNIVVKVDQPNYLTNPASCAATAITGTTASSAGDTVPFSTVVQFTGCASLGFAPTLTVSPSTTMWDAPLGVGVDLHIPAGDADLQNAVVTLPAGVSINPGVANGLQACSDAQLGVGTSNPVTCPQASQVGTVTITSPLLPTPLTGAIYIGAPQPGNLYRIFLAATSASYGISVRLIGTLSPNPSNGQLTTTFSNTPPIPFTDLQLNFNGGPNAVLASPQTCGPATTTSTLTGSTGSIATPSDAYTVDDNGQGGACPGGLGFAPTLSVGAQSTAAGALDNPFTVSFASGDQQQQLDQVSVTLPPGLLGNLASVPLCDATDAAHGTCSALSQIGTVSVTSGVGSGLQLPGQVYLTGPYGGGPFGLSIVVPAVAGPYNLGTVVLQASISVDPHDAHLTVASQPFPTILQGVPLRLKAVSLTINRPGFLFNPTNCQARSASASITGTGGATATPQAGFAATGCGALGFSPTVSGTITGSTNVATGAGLAITLDPKAGQADLQQVSVRLPTTVSARLSVVSSSCTVATYQANPAACPAASRVGSAEAKTPALPDALSAAVYLVDSGNGTLPSLDVPLSADGVTEDLSGTINITSSGLVTTFSGIPDVPISSFTLQLTPGPDSALTLSKALSCAAPPSAATALTGQNGVTVNGTVKLQVGGGCGGVKAASVTTGPSKWLKIKVLRVKHLRDHALRLELQLPASGKVALSARAIRRVSAWAAKKHRDVWVTVHLSQYGQRKIRHHRSLQVKARFGYRARTGRSGWIDKSIRFT